MSDTDHCNSTLYIPNMLYVVTRDAWELCHIGKPSLKLNYLGLIWDLGVLQLLLCHIGKPSSNLSTRDYLGLWCLTTITLGMRTCHTLTLIT